MYDTGERKCYRLESPYFHKATRNGCKKHEDSFQERRELKLGSYEKKEASR